MTFRPEHLVVTGGPSHDFDGTTGELVDVASSLPLRTTVVDTVDDMVDALAEPAGTWSLVTCNLLAWAMRGRRADDRQRWAYDLTDRDAEVIWAYVTGGGAVLAMHTAVICFDAHPRWRDVLGASWDWSMSSHPPPGRVDVEATGVAHDISNGDAAFCVHDELYCDLDIDRSVEPLYVGRSGAASAPVVWCREVGDGRVVVDVLGHDVGSLRQESHRRLLGRAYRWLLGDQDATPHEEVR